MMEVAKRLCTDHNVSVAEIYSYHLVGDELRFVPVYRAPADTRARRRLRDHDESRRRTTSSDAEDRGRSKKAKPA